MLDNNIKMDYSKIRYLVILDKKLNDHFSRIKHINENNNIEIMYLIDSFNVTDLSNEESFVSLLFYFGLISIDKYEKGQLILKSPNRSKDKFIGGYMIDAYKDTDIFRMDLSKLSKEIRKMAYEGE